MPSICTSLIPKPSLPNSSLDHFQALGRSCHVCGGRYTWGGGAWPEFTFNVGPSLASWTTSIIDSVLWMFWPSVLGQTLQERASWCFDGHVLHVYIPHSIFVYCNQSKVVKTYVTIVCNSGWKCLHITYVTPNNLEIILSIKLLY